MPITRHDLRRGSVLENAALFSRLVIRPASDPQGIAVENDPTNISVGDDLIASYNGGAPFGILGHGINMTYLDAAGSDFGGIMRIVGLNHLGNRIEEVVGIQPSGIPISNSGRAWSVIEHVFIDQWDNADAADTMQLGWNTAGASNPERLRLGFPWEYRGPDDYIDLIRANPTADAGDHLTPGQVNSARGTFTLAVDDAIGILRQYQFVMNRLAPHL